MAAFPLLHLPLLAMEHVLSMMNPFELINFSLISSRSKRSIKNFSRIQKRVVLAITNEPHVTIHGKHEQWSFIWTSDDTKLGYGKRTCLGHVFHTVYKFSKNPIDELMNEYDYIRGALRCQLIIVYFELDLYRSQNKWITDWIRSQQTLIPSLRISNFDKDEDLQYLLNNITVSNDLILSPKQGFQIDLPSTPHLKIENSSFFNFKQLLRLKNSSISLYRSSLTEQEVNRFLKSWMACESHLELKSFEIHFPDREFMNVIMDLPHEVTNNVESFKKKFYNPYVEEGFDIKRCDGKVATVGYGDNTYGLRFFMLIH